MARVRPWFLWLVLLLIGATRLWAASAAETRAFEAASGAFQHKVWDRAEGLFAAFRQEYTNSTRLPEAILYQAESRLQRGNYDGAIALLTPNLDLAGNWADEYVFFIGEGQFQKGELNGAAETFAKLVRTFPASGRRLEALIRQATARAKLATAADWHRVTDLLQATNGLFQAMARTNTANEFVWRGYLLLGEALLAQTNYGAAELALQPLLTAKLGPEIEWQRQFLLSRIQLADNRADAARQSGANLLALADAARQPALKAESAALLGEIYERLGGVDEAIAAYQLNLPDGVPPERQRQAVLKITELLTARNRIAEAAQLLQRFLEQTPNAKAADLALVNLGELRLRLAGIGETVSPGTNAAPGTNYLQLALAALQSFTNKFPQSPLFGKAELSLGWCYWLSNALPESQAAFQTATHRLPPATDQASAYDLAVAHFKLGDTLFKQTNYSEAIPQYRMVAEQFTAWPQVQTNLCEPALYQIVRAGLNAGNLSAASNAMARIVALFPVGFYTDRAVLLTGQTIGASDPAAARKLFVGFTEAITNSPLRSEVELAIARTYEQENQWERAAGQYDQWLITTPTNNPELPQALYFRAMANRWAGYETNTLTQLTNFVERFPAHELTPLARWWVADYYDRIGRLEAAEANFELIFQNTNWAGTPIAFHAQMAAGRVAFKRTSWTDAKGYFGGLASNTNCPAPLRAQAYFALGSVFMSSQEATNKADYHEALYAFDQVGVQSPTNSAMAVLALGAKGDCFLQSHDYASASNAYQRVLQSPVADVAARSAASVGLGVVLEKLAQQTSGPSQAELLIQARDRYLDVFEKRILRDGETSNDYWRMKSGQEAARLLVDAFKQRGAALQIYCELQEDYPFLRLGDRINTLKAQPGSPAMSKNP
jgi:TolA-binding protein